MSVSGDFRQTGKRLSKNDMNIHGQPLSNPSTSIFQLRRGHLEPLVLQLRPLSLGFHQRLKERGFHLPLPPLKIARDSTGKPLRDAQGQLLTQPERQDPEYLAALDDYHQSVAVLSVVESLRGSSEVTFETPVPRTNDAAEWREYARLVFTEMEAAGFVAGDLILLCREICRLSNLIEDHLAAARQNFSSSPASSPG